MNTFFKKGAALALTATLATGLFANDAHAANFKDISGYSATTQLQINMLAYLGVVKGTSSTTFSPAVEITRGQVVKLLGRFLVENRLATIPKDWKTKQRFKDLSLKNSDEELLMYGAIVYDKGIFKGNNGYLQSKGKLTRENMALLMNRTATALTGKSFVEIQKAEGAKHNVSDLLAAKAESRDAIAALNALGVSNGAQFKPKNNLQRVHLVSFLSNAMDVALKYK